MLLVSGITGAGRNRRQTESNGNRPEIKVLLPANSCQGISNPVVPGQHGIQP